MGWKKYKLCKFFTIVELAGCNIYTTYQSKPFTVISNWDPHFWQLQSVCLKKQKQVECLCSKWKEKSEKQK